MINGNRSAPPPALIDYYRRVDAGTFDDLVAALSERVVFEVAGGADREGSQCARHEGRQQVRDMLAQRGVLPIVHRPVHVGSVGARAWLVEGVATDPAGDVVAQFIVDVDLDGAGRLVRYRTHACPPTPMLPSAGAETDPISHAAVRQFRERGFGAFNRIAENAVGSVVAPANGTWDAVRRVDVAGRRQLGEAIEAMLTGVDSVSLHRVVDGTHVTLLSGAFIARDGRCMRTFAARVAVDKSGSLAQLLGMTAVLPDIHHHEYLNR